MPYYLPSPVGWGCRIRRLQLCKGERPYGECPAYETKSSDGEAFVLGFRGMQSTPFITITSSNHVRVTICRGVIVVNEGCYLIVNLKRFVMVIIFCNEYKNNWYNCTVYEDLLLVIWFLGFRYLILLVSPFGFVGVFLSVKAEKEFIKEGRNETKIPFLFQLYFLVQQPFCGCGNSS